MTLHTDALIWTFAHSLWQGAVLVILVQLLFLVLPRWQASQRARVSLLAIYVLPVVSLVTYGMLHSEPISAHISVGSAQPYSGMDFLFLSWLLGWIISTGKLIYDWRTCRQWVKQAAPMSNLSLLKRANQLRARIGLKQSVDILQSAAVLSPVLVGVLRPAILLPIACLNKLTIDELEAVIAHELAHVRRLDFLHAIIIAVVKSAYFFNPAIYWLHNRHREDRELACDDLAQLHLYDKTSLAAGLLKLSLFATHNTIAVNARGKGNLPAVQYRAERLLGRQAISAKPPREFSTAVLNAFLICGAIALSAFSSPSPTQTVAQFDRPELIELKQRVCDVFNAQNIYFNPKYDKGGPALVTLVDGKISMNHVELPANTNRTIQSIFKEFDLMSYDDVRLNFYGEDVYLQLDNEQTKGQVQTQSFETWYNRKVIKVDGPWLIAAEDVSEYAIRL